MNHKLQYQFRVTLIQGSLDYPLPTSVTSTQDIVILDCPLPFSDFDTRCTLSWITIAYLLKQTTYVFYTIY